MSRPPAKAHGSDNAVDVWDSRAVPASQALGAFRDVISSAFMPWTPDIPKNNVVFEGRVESLSIGRGSVGLCRTTGVDSSKTKSNIANSPAECVYGNYVLSGEIHIEQADVRHVVRPGELILYHSYKPTRYSDKSGVRNANIAFSIPVETFSDTVDVESNFINTLLPAASLMEPLVGCFNMMARGMHLYSSAQMAALFNACAVLLPLSAGRLAPHEPEPRQPPLRMALKLVDDMLSDPDLTPQSAALRLGVSTRQLHRMFARSGDTFGNYVMNERLERVRGELMSKSDRTPISQLVFRWGFNDLSTFNRAFKRRFGQSPRSMKKARAE